MLEPDSDLKFFVEPNKGDWIGPKIWILDELISMIEIGELDDLSRFHSHSKHSLLGSSRSILKWEFRDAKDLSVALAFLNVRNYRLVKTPKEL